MMRAPGQSTRGADAASEMKALKRQIDILNRRTQNQPKAKPVVSGGGGPIGSTRLTAVSWSDGNGLGITGWSAAPTPTLDGVVPPGWAPPPMYYPGPGTQWAAAPVPAESGWYQASAHAHLAFSGGAPTDVTMELVTDPSAYYASSRVNAIGTSPSVHLGVSSLPWYQRGGDPDGMYSGNLWVQFNWDGAATIASYSQIYMDIVRLG